MSGIVCSYILFFPIIVEWFILSNAKHWKDKQMYRSTSKWSVISWIEVFALKPDLFGGCYKNFTLEQPRDSGYVYIKVTLFRAIMEQFEEDNHPNKQN